nr:MAG TPA: hypothetical protein [Caudoviricetes sp.]
MKCEYPLNGGRKLVISAKPFTEPGFAEDDEGNETAVVISINLCEKGKQILLLKGYPGEIDGFVTFLQNRVDDIQDMEELRKKGWEGDK